MADVAFNSKEANEARRKRVFVGALPPDFLKIPVSEKQKQEAADQQAALALHHQLLGGSFVQNAVGRLNITVAQAKLVKNYGMTRMDPYVRLRVGHCVYETQTCANGGKNPHWSNVVQCLLPPGVNTISVEIYDDCSFTMDELIAWSHIPIPPNVLKGETHDGWFPLSGKQGDDEEGMINLVLSYESGPPRTQCVYSPRPIAAPVMMVPSTNPTVLGIPQFAPVPVYTQLPNQVVANSPAKDLQQIQEMFPNIDNEVIKSVFEANGRNKDITVNSLLQMSDA